MPFFIIFIIRRLISRRYFIVENNAVFFQKIGLDKADKLRYNERVDFVEYICPYPHKLCLAARILPYAFSGKCLFDKKQGEK